MTVEDEEGVTHAWVEVCLDDTWYTVDASKETDQITTFVPESTDVEGMTLEPTEEDMLEAEAAAAAAAGETADGEAVDPEAEGTGE